VVVIGREKSPRMERKAGGCSGGEQCIDGVLQGHRLRNSAGIFPPPPPPGPPPFPPQKRPSGHVRAPIRPFLEWRHRPGFLAPRFHASRYGSRQSFMVFPRICPIRIAVRYNPSLSVGFATLLSSRHPCASFDGIKRHATNYINLYVFHC